MSDRRPVFFGDGSMLTSPVSRRSALRAMALGGVVVIMPSMLSGCSDDDLTGPGDGPGEGDPVTIDFSKGDVAVLQFAYALEQLEADFYTRVVAGAATSGLSASEQAIMVDVRNHEVLHRELYKAALGTTNGFTLTTTYPGVDFTSRTSILNTAKTFEDLGVAAYNGAAQYISDAATLTLAGKIVSVEARHASAIADLLAPGTTAFAPKAFDDAFSPSKVAAAAQGFVVDELAFANAPSSFVQGPNNNG